MSHLLTAPIHKSKKGCRSLVSCTTFDSIKPSLVSHILPFFPNSIHARLNNKLLLYR